MRANTRIEWGHSICGVLCSPFFPIVMYHEHLLMSAHTQASFTLHSLSMGACVVRVTNPNRHPTVTACVFVHTLLHVSPWAQFQEVELLGWRT